MKTVFPKLKWIGKRAISFLLSVLLIFQIMDFSVISIGATEESGNLPSQNEQTEPENSETSNVESEPVEYEDWTVSDSYTLTEDKEVNNMTMNGGTLNLDGHSLIVHGNVSVYRGTLYINKGYLHCFGNIQISGYYAYLTMENVNDEIVADGDFIWNYANSGYIKNGCIKVGGDFRDDTTGGSYNFISSEKNELILNGNSEQHIIQKNVNSYINILKLDNSSQERIVYAETPVIAGTIIKNGCNISYTVGGTYGHKLQNDETIQGDFYLVGDELDLNGKTLTITGNLIQGAGTVKVNGGELNIGGDYIIRSYTLDENNSPIYHYSLGELVMTNANDEVNVSGNFVMGSSKDHRNLLTNGILRVGGNFEQITVKSAYNFAPKENHKVILNGQSEQIIKFESSSYDTSHFANVEFANTTANAIKITDGTIVTGEVSVTGGKPAGNISLYTTATLLSDSSGANINIKLPYGYTLSNDLTVNGNVIANGTVNLNRKTLTTNDFNAYNAEININNGRLICRGSLYLQNNYYYSCYLKMINELDYVRVDGDFISENYCYDMVMSAGTLEIKGDFTQKSGVSNTNEYNFRATGTHKTVFSGTQEQTISFSSPKSYFNEVEINNTSQNGVYITNFFNHSKLTRTFGEIHFSDNTTVGETLEADKTVNDLYLGSGVYDLAGHTLTVNGNLVQSGGTMKINNGHLRVTGNYFIQKEVTENGKTIYEPSAGYL
uniref:hypothetical protein n=1 Tax=Methanobrevibacter sp. TaxID=66852 RepID=UPI0038657BF2